MGLEFQNPVGLAAGLDKDAEHIDAFGGMGFGFVLVAARLTEYDTIHSMLKLEEPDVFLLMGAAIGIASGIGLAFLVRSTTPLPAAIAPWSVALGVFLGVAVGMTAGVYPATRAAKLDPIKALSQE